MPFHPPHLQRLGVIRVTHPVYFITTCTYHRRAILCEDRVAQILMEEWSAAHDRHNWSIGRFVIMPDHVHFFAAPHANAKSLELFMAKWKEWTAKRINPLLKLQPSLWQDRFFDHLLRSRESCSEKWQYVRDNPVRAGLVSNPDSWPFQGSIHFK